MKKAINLIIIYFVFLIGGILFGTLLYTLFSNLLHYVAGSKLKLFSVDSLFQSFFYISFCMIFLICPAIAFYRIRHPGGASQGIAYIILSLFTWFLLFPIDNRFCNYILDNYFPEEDGKIYLSKDYFRHTGDEVYYFTKDFSYSAGGGVEADAIVINTSDDGYVDFRPVRDTPSLKLNSKALPFREILVSESFRSQTKTTYVDFSALLKEARRSVSSGFISFLFYLSFALALCSIYMITNLFDWKLLNSLLLFLLTTFVMGINSGLASGWINSITPSLSKNAVYSFLLRWNKDPIIFIFNCLFFLIILIIWIVTSIVKNHNKKQD